MSHGSIGLELPRFISVTNKWFFGMVLFGLAGVIYVGSNHYHFSSPIYLPYTHWDYLVPFLPQTIWIYMSEYFFFLVTYVALRREENVNRFFFSFLFQQTVAVLVFLAWPTTFPRSLFPLNPEMMDHFTFGLFAYLRSVDTPASCCPSLHVSSIFLCMLVFLDEKQARLRAVLWVWGAMIIATTVTTKQHYVIDVVVGLMLGLTSFFLFHRLFSLKRKVSDSLTYVVIPQGTASDHFKSDV
jgi:membrane-associated phospholipid phosphatase